MNHSIKYINKVMGKLDLENKKTEDNLSNVFRQVLGAGLEPARTLLFIGF